MMTSELINIENGKLNEQKEILLPKNEQKVQNNWKQLGLLLLGTSFFGNGTLGITKSILSIYMKSLGFDAAQIGFVASARGFKAIIDMFAGYIGDKSGRKVIAYIGQFFLVISHLMYGTSSTLGGFIASGMVHGTGSGFNAGAATFGSADLMRKSKALGQGLFRSCKFWGAKLNRSLSLYLYNRYGHQSPFIIFRLMPIFGALIVWKFVKEPKDIGNEKLQNKYH